MQKVFRNTIKELSNYISLFNTNEIFFVIDANSYDISGAKLFIEQKLQLKTNTIFSDFNPNPKLEDLEKGIALFNSKEYNLIIAIGGGSVLDMAKLISIMAHQTEDIAQITKGKATVNNKKTKLIAIPTTAGTGAEATAFSVLYIDKVKYSVASDSILPDLVFLSSEFSLSAPAYLTASTGLDAFSQAIESVWSVNSTTESEKYALKAIKLVWNNLKKAVKNNDKDAKTKMQEAAFLAGKAINITTTTAPHALSYAFTSYYNIPHGHAVAISLPFFFEYNYNLSDNDCNDKRGSLAVKNRIENILEILNLNPQNIKQELVKFFNQIEININTETLIKDFDIDIVLKNVNLERLRNNPRIINKNDIKNAINS